MKFIKNIITKVVDFLMDLLTPAAVKAEIAKTAQVREQAQADIKAAKEQTAQVEAQCEEAIAAITEKDLEDHAQHFVVMKILTLCQLNNLSFDEARLARDNDDKETLVRILREMEAGTYVAKPYVSKVAKVVEKKTTRKQRRAAMRKPQARFRPA